MNEPVLVDTDVVSFEFKQDTRGELYRPFLEGHLLVISFQTLAELLLWPEIAGWQEERRLQLENHLQKFVVTPYDEGLCHVWAKVIASSRLAGRPIQAGDAWIAATAIYYDLFLVTNNPKDYRGLDELKILTHLP